MYDQSVSHKSTSKCPYSTKLGVFLNFCHQEKKIESFLEWKSEKNTPWACLGLKILKILYILSKRKNLTLRQRKVTLLTTFLNVFFFLLNLKGNEVVIKLQTREKSLVEQIKLKTRILTEQEKVMKEKEKEIDDLKTESKELKQQVSNLSDESKDLKNTLQKKSVELEEAAKLLKRDENIISWLNKQITDNNLASNGANKLGGGNYDMGGGVNGQGVVFKPYGALLPSNGSLSALNNGSSPQNQHLIDSGLNMMRLNSGGLASTNQYLNKSNERLYLSNSNQPMYPNNYQNRASALSSSSNSSLQQCTDSLKENQEK